MAGSLQEQMLKLGLVDEKQVQKVEGDKKTPRRAKGRRESRPKGGGLRRELVDARRLAEERIQRGADLDLETEKRIEVLINDGRRKGKVEGRRRFYFDSRDGRVPHLDLSDEVVGELESGIMLSLIHI